MLSPVFDVIAGRITLHFALVTATLVRFTNVTLVILNQV